MAQSLEADGLLISFNRDKLDDVRVCLVGPNITPCEHCFDLLTFTLARNHPAELPKAKYLTNNGTCRFNPISMST
jgi:hypothetical protein